MLELCTPDHRTSQRELLSVSRKPGPARYVPICMQHQKARHPRWRIYTNAARASGVQYTHQLCITARMSAPRYGRPGCRHSSNSIRSTMIRMSLCRFGVSTVPFDGSLLRKKVVEMCHDHATITASILVAHNAHQQSYALNLLVRCFCASLNSRPSPTYGATFDGVLPLRKFPAEALWATG